MADRCFYFGCWNVSGHYLFVPGGHSLPYAEEQKIVYYGHHRHLDGTLAPRKLRDYYGGALCWGGQDPVAVLGRKDMDINHQSSEYPQGLFLRHELDNGYTAIQWWDRCQGDTRGACNSTILVSGKHTSEEMLAALRENFPHVLENLQRGGPDWEKLRRGYGNENWKPPENQGRIDLVEVVKT